jgi:hypothetical protein
MAAQRGDDVPRYLVEWYRPGLTGESLEQTAQRIGRSAEEPSSDFGGVDLLLTLYLPGDEVAFCLFAADSADAVAQVCRRAGIPYHRIAEAVEATASCSMWRPGDRQTVRHGHRQVVQPPRCECWR